jgi:hypothetical protein
LGPQPTGIIALYDEDSAVILWKDDGLVVTEIGPVCAVVWRSSVTRERFQAQRLGLDRVVRANPGGAGFLCVIEPTSPVPNLDLQRASGTMVAIQRPHLRYLACVIEGDTLRALIVRTVLNRMRAMVTGRFPLGFFAAVDEAAVPMVEALPAAGSAESVTASVEDARAVLPPASRPD